MENVPLLKGKRMRDILYEASRETADKDLRTFGIAVSIPDFCG